MISYYLACLDCGWYGKFPNIVGTHAPIDVCGNCGDFYHTRRLVVPAHNHDLSKEPINYNNIVGPGSKVWMNGRNEIGRVLAWSTANDKVMVKWEGGDKGYYIKKDLYRITSTKKGF